MGLSISPTMKQIIARCRKDPTFFIENFCKVRHPTAGVIPFKLFKYQQKSLDIFKKKRYSIYRKVRQCGVSTLTGVYGLQLAMFNNHKTVLIVSKTDEDAKEYLAKNIKFVYEYLPDCFKKIWGDPDGKISRQPPIYSQHQVIFPNGSSIKSLTSAPNALRSNSSSLNIIDEAAFMPDMDAMWCVSPDTVIMSNGDLIRMSEVKVGDKISSKNGQNNCVKVHHRKNVEAAKITVSGGYEIIAGLNHKLMYGGAWNVVKDLKVGDKLDHYDGDKFSVREIKSIERTKLDVMDLMLDGDHSYISNGFISHNSGGQPVIGAHGGQCICISTCKGLGNWYYNTWMDAEAGTNEFYPIHINWWDQDWEIKYMDSETGKEKVISPTKDIRPTKTEEERKKYGPYWSPWLEEQYRALQQRGVSHLFRQEILAEFLGTGNTVIDVETLHHIQNTKSDDYKKIGKVDYEHSSTGEKFVLDFEDLLWVWKEPVRPQADIIDKGQIVRKGDPGHNYVMGVDISSGEASDYSAIEILDCNTKEQVAELKIKVLPNILVMMIDMLARYYNNALVVCERTGIGTPVAQDVYGIGYTNVYRMRRPNGKRDRKIGFPTSPAHKPEINKALMTMLGPDGYQVYSVRLDRELSIYVHLSGGRTGAEHGIGNHDDLSISLGLALIGAQEVVQMDMNSMVPFRGDTASFINDQTELSDIRNTQLELAGGGMGSMVPFVDSDLQSDVVEGIEEEMRKFARSMGGLTKEQASKRWLENNQGARAKKYIIDTKLNKKNVN